MKIINEQSCFTVHSKFAGYAGIGIGTQTMKGSDMYIGYQNSTGGVTIANMKGTGHVAPTPVGLVTSIPLLETKPAFSKLSFSFCKVNANSSNYIYAAETEKPTGNVNSQSVSLEFHTGVFDSFVLDLAGSTTVAPSGNGAILQTNSKFTKEDVYKLHGALMLFAWSISPFIGIFIARFMKTKLGHNWYRLHVFFMGAGTFLVSFVSFILIVLYRSPPHFVGDESITTTHIMMGLLLTILVLFQVILGYISDAMFSEKRKFIPWYN
jgi:hypothetical protein